MGGKLGGGGGPLADISVTPLIDVVFQLLVFFMLTSTFAAPALDLTLPQLNDNVSPSEPNAWSVEIDAMGTIMIEGTPASGDLTQQFANLAQSNEARTAVALRADQATDHGIVLELMQALGDAGLSQVFFVYEPKTDGTATP